ncbi:MAG: transposase [Nitrospirae bacterium RIFCSPLOWO2_02_FULL_62_14]|nr:MAG: transposase [Nitrospirae bacterium RIFCSPLOWO2_02_FULL_62_14]TKS61728.1 MAG: IS30 family transposase [Nitrospira sp.]
MARYHRLNVMEREELSRLLAAGSSLRAIGRALSRAPSTVSRELARQPASPVTYRAVRAQQRAQRWARHPRKTRKLTVQPRLRTAVFTLLAQRWSPEQIARGLPQRYPHEPTMRISHEAIYTYLYVLPRGAFKRELVRYLRRRHRFRRPRKVRLSSRPIQDLISIDERPAEVAARTVPGHWEGDLLVGHANASALGTLVERTTRFTLLVPLKAKDAATVRQAFARDLRTLPAQLRRSLTYDQGPEMREHRLFTKQTKMRVYFAHPHCPWERGTNENTNGLLRQFFPKGTRFNRLSRTEIKRVQAMFNDRPRKVLNWHSPAHAFTKLLR